MNTPASPGEVGFRLPLMWLGLCFAAAPKLVNSTLFTERFIAFAISRVSSVPAAPTTMPAIISAGFCSTKPPSATASPVAAL